MSSSTRVGRCFFFGAAAAIALAAGCARTVVEQSVVDLPGMQQDELAYWEAIESRFVVSNNDALHALILLADGADDSVDYEARIAKARARGWVKGRPGPANESAQIGIVAVGICQILEIKGGLTMRLFGPSPRYCTRELIFLELLPPRADTQAITGLELAELIGRASQVIEGRSKL